MPQRPPQFGAAFWSAIEMAAGSDRAEDLADVGRYVASRGPKAVASFEADLERAIGSLREAGVAEVLRTSGRTADGRRIADLADADLGHCLEAMVLAQRPWFERLLDRPELAHSMDQVPIVDLRQAVRAAGVAAAGTGSPLWVEHPGDRRRDGRPWIEVYLARGAGIGPMGYPWDDRQFHLRFVKTALLRSLDDDWRSWRMEAGARTLDVWLEYVPSDAGERLTVTSLGRSAGVTILRHAHRLQELDDPAALGDREAHLAIASARAALMEPER